MGMDNMIEMHRLTTAALQFVQSVNEYVKMRGYILLQEEPIIHLRTEERLSMTITQPVYVGESDIEMTVAGYLEESAGQEMVVETTFDFLLGESLTIHEIHEYLKSIRDERTSHFFICVRGAQEDGVRDDEISVVVRKRHRFHEAGTFNQWDTLIQLFQKGQTSIYPPFPLKAWP